MSEPMTHDERLRKTWLAADSTDREALRQIWPDLADCLDAVAWRPLDEMIAKEIDEQVAGMNIDVKAGLRDVLEKAGVPEDMIRKMTCDGCRTIERLRSSIRPGNEEDFYQFQRAERAHRRECPNR